MKDKSEYYKHEKAIVESESIGAGTRIWANAHVMSNVVIGMRCNIGEGCFVESGVTIGNDVVIKNNVAVWKGVTIEDAVFLGPSVVLTNEIEPRATFPKDLATILLKKGASVGANATIVANRIIGEYATIGAGSVVTRDVPAHRLVYGAPAKIQGWVCTCGRKLTVADGRASCQCGRRFRTNNSSIVEEHS